MNKNLPVNGVSWVPKLPDGALDELSLVWHITQWEANVEVKLYINDYSCSYTSLKQATISKRSLKHDLSAYPLLVGTERNSACTAT